MSTIDRHIEELLHNHDCVIVPEFGGFITSKKPAYYNQFTSVFYPATKKLLFNKHLVYNDGLLAAKIAERRELSMEEATQLLIQYKDDCYVRLNEEGRVEIEKVGVLFFDKEKNLQFQQASTNFLTDSFGLSSLSLDKIKEETPVVKSFVKPIEVSRVEESKEDRKPVKVVKTTEKRKRRTAVLIPLLIIPFLVGGLYLGNQQGIIGENKINLASINPFYTPDYSEYTPRDGKTYLVKKEDVIEEPISETIPVEEVSNSTDETIEEKEIKIIPSKVDSTYVESKKVEKRLKYHVIIGCFSIKNNAENLVAEWQEKGNASTIVDKKGSLYRVAIQSFESRRKAKAFLKEIKKEYKNSLWILKK